MTSITANADRKRAAYHVVMALLDDPVLAQSIPSSAQVTPVGFEDAAHTVEVVAEPVAAPRTLLSVSEHEIA